MLFDLRPKSRREDIFDREGGEFRELEESVKTYPITLLLGGIRRVGKSSILRAYLNGKQESWWTAGSSTVRGAI